MSIVYGKTEPVLTDSLQRTMYDIPVVTCSQATGSKSDDDSSVLQIRETDSNLNQSQALHQNWISAKTPTPMTPRPAENAFIVQTKPEPQPKKQSKARARLKRFRGYVHKLVSSKYFELFIVFCILLNTLFMAIEYHDMDPTLQHVVLVANMVRTLPSFVKIWRFHYRKRNEKYKIQNVEGIYEGAASSRHQLVPDHGAQNRSI